MNPIAIYAVATLIILGLSGIVVWGFSKYRFKGDRTGMIIITFYATFLIIILLTLTLLHPASTAPSNAF